MRARFEPLPISGGAGSLLGWLGAGLRVGLRPPSPRRAARVARAAAARCCCCSCLLLLLFVCCCCCLLLLLLLLLACCSRCCCCCYCLATAVVARCLRHCVLLCICVTSTIVSIHVPGVVSGARTRETRDHRASKGCFHTPMAAGVIHPLLLVLVRLLSALPSA